MRRATLLIAGLLALEAGAPAATAAMPRFKQFWGVAIQAVYDQHGNPSLVANFSPSGGLAKPHWAICSPHTNVCRAAGNGSQELSPGATRAGTVFRATATYKGKNYTATTAVWEGQLHATRAPKLVGQPLVGARVNVTRAVWSGGWREDPTYHQRPGIQSGGRALPIDWVSIEACRTRSATSCVTLTPSGSEGASLVHPIRIQQRYKGWYLFGFDQHFSGDEAFATPVQNPAPTLIVGPTIARSGPSGPIR